LESITQSKADVHRIYTGFTRGPDLADCAAGLTAQLSRALAGEVGCGERDAMVTALRAAADRSKMNKAEVPTRPIHPRLEPYSPPDLSPAYPLICTRFAPTRIRHGQVAAFAEV
jgi:hypothetical protein